MPTSHARRSPASPRVRLKNGSSRPPKAVRGPAEPTHFQGLDLAGAQVHGRVDGWRTPVDPMRRLLGAYLEALGLSRAGVSLQWVDDEECARLNRSFRGIDAPTDILSFPSQTGKARPGDTRYLGDLALNLPYAWRKRGRFHPRFEGEVAFLALHGLLHLCGLHHDTPAQERALWRVQDQHFPPAAVLLAPLRGLKPKRSK